MRYAQFYGLSLALLRESGEAREARKVREAGEARQHAGTMTVEGVATLEEALEALARHGGRTRDLQLPTG